MSTGIERALQEAIRANWSITQLEASLAEKYGLAEWQRALFARVWKKQQTKVRETLSSAVAFSDRLRTLDWRIDTKARSKSHEELSGLCAIVELTTTAPRRPGAAEAGAGGDSVLRFELDREQLEQTLLQIRALKAIIAAQTGAQPQAAGAPAPAAAPAATTE